MSNLTGIEILGGYAATVLTTTGDTALVTAQISKLEDLIPPVDAPAQSGGGMLDEMTPVAAAHLLVELAALKAVFSDAG